MCDPFFFLKIGSVAREQILEGDIWHTVADSGKSNLDSQHPDFPTFRLSDFPIELCTHRECAKFSFCNTEY